MPKIKYESVALRADTLKVVAQANLIVEEYAAMGYELTLRQLYYQFVARDLMANTQNNYKRLGDIISKARRGGLIDWYAIVDRTRFLRRMSSWQSPTQIVEGCAEQFRYDLWATQRTYCEVWFEKDALLSVFERAANEHRVPFFSCRGYTSDSEVWGAAQRLHANSRDAKNRPRDIVVLHFGDHDPSGLDMTRDIEERLRLFGAPDNLDVRRLALNMSQVRQYDPPPNPAKETDSRFTQYEALYGSESWELDALDPAVLGELVRAEVESLIERKPWDKEIAREVLARDQLAGIAENYSDVVGFLAKRK